MAALHEMKKELPCQPEVRELKDGIGRLKRLSAYVP